MSFRKTVIPGILSLMAATCILHGCAKQPPASVSIQTQERHGNCDYALITIEFFYQLNDRFEAPANSIYAFANYSVRADLADRPHPSIEHFAIVTDDGNRYLADPQATRDFDRSYLSSSVHYSGVPYYTSESVPPGKWQDYFAVFLIPTKALAKHPKLVFINDK